MLHRGLGRRPVMDQPVPWHRLWVHEPRHQTRDGQTSESCQVGVPIQPIERLYDRIQGHSFYSLVIRAVVNLNTF